MALTPDQIKNTDPNLIVQTYATERNAALDKEFGTNPPPASDAAIAKALAQGDLSVEIAKAAQDPVKFKETLLNQAQQQSQPTVVTGQAGDVATMIIRPDSKKSPPQSKISSRIQSLIGSASGITPDIQENILNKFDRYTYHIELSMISDADAAATDLLDRLRTNKVKKIIIAESGVTDRFNLTECVITNYPGPNFRTRNTVTCDIQLSLVQPYSLSLPSAMFEASSRLGNFNWRLAPVILTLSFRAINEDGTFAKQNVLPTWTYKINIHEFDASLTEAGAVYKINAVTDNSIGFTDFNFVIPQTYTLDLKSGGAVKPTPYTPTNGQTPIFKSDNAGSVGTFFQNLGDNLTQYYKKQRASSETGANPSPIIIFDFQVDEQLRNRKIDFTPFTNNRRQSLSYQGGVITVGRGISIGSLLDDILSSILDADAKDFFFKKDDKAGRIRIPRIECITDIVGWDELLSDYIRKFTYVINVKESTRIVPTNDYGQAFQDIPQNSANRLEVISTEKILQKAYFYYYTGLNSEIVHLDVNFQNLYYVLTPMGSTSMPAQYGSSLKTALGELTQLKAQQSALQTQQAAITALRNSQTLKPGLTSLYKQTFAQGVSAEISQQSLQDINVQLTAVNNQIAKVKRGGLVFFDPVTLQALNIGSDAKNPTLTAAQDAASVTAQFYDNVSKLGRNGYKQFLVQSAQKSSLSTGSAQQSIDHLSYVTDPRDPANMIRPPADTSIARDIYGVVQTQMYQRIDSQMTEIEMEIRGDPYWLGISNLERTTELREQLSSSNNTSQSGKSKDKSVANFYDQDPKFLLSFRAGDEPDENSGFMKLSNQQYFQAVYTPYEVTNTFINGQFKQKLKCNRDPLIKIPATTPSSTANKSATQPPTAPPAKNLATAAISTGSTATSISSASQQTPTVNTNNAFQFGTINNNPIGTNTKLLYNQVSSGVSSWLTQKYNAVSNFFSNNNTPPSPPMSGVAGNSF